MKTKFYILTALMCALCLSTQIALSASDLTRSVVRTLPSISIVSDTLSTLKKNDNAAASSVIADSLNTLAEGKSVAISDSIQANTQLKDSSDHSKSALDMPVQYTASDSITFEYGKGLANLWGNSKVNYQNLELQAEVISMNLDSSVVHASGRVDSLGNRVGEPIFKQGNDEYEPERVSYNFKSKKAF